RISPLLRSSAAPEDGRHATARHLVTATRQVAILGRPGGPPPRPVGAARFPRMACCYPRPPRRTPATPATRSPASRSPSCCDPRPPRRTAATPPPVTSSRRRGRLRSSAAPEDGRHVLSALLDFPAWRVAILGRPGGRPPPRRPGPRRRDRRAVAILGRPGGRP